MEKQFSERQLIRWAIPGWITLFLMILLVFSHLILDRQFGSCIWPFPLERDGATFAAVGAAVIASGFALGFMLFQVYFAVYWCDCRVSLILIGGVVNHEEIVDSLKGKFKDRLEKEFGHWPLQADLLGTKRQRMEASVAAAAWRGISHKKEQRMVWEDRNQYLVSVYHSLGATLVGAYLTFILYALAVIRLGMWHGGWAALSVNIVILITWIFVLLIGRKNTEFSHRNLTKHALYHFYQQDEEEDDK